MIIKYNVAEKHSYFLNIVLENFTECACKTFWEKKDILYGYLHS